MYQIYKTKQHQQNNKQKRGEKTGNRKRLRDDPDIGISSQRLNISIVMLKMSKKIGKVGNFTKKLESLKSHIEILYAKYSDRN